MKIKYIINLLNEWAPPSYQESYDNSGLIVGDPQKEVTGVLVSLDCIESVIDEAIRKKCNIIIAHHPIVFKGLKTITGKNYVERTIIKAIKNDIAIFGLHTNLDHILDGVNQKICDIIGLKNRQILSPKKGLLNKLVTFIPEDNTDEVLNELYKVGAGKIGNYDQCSFSVNGTGTFRANEHANPYSGTRGVKKSEKEDRVEIIFPAHLSQKIIHTLQKYHPYEEVAYYHQDLKNSHQEVGAGMIGELETDMNTQDFMHLLKDKFNLSIIKHTDFHKNKVKKIAVCGGAGSFLLSTAKSLKADVFVSSDFKYHEYFDAEKSIIIADIGHYESEVFTKELIYDFLKENLANIAVNFSMENTNPVNYF